MTPRQPTHRRPAGRLLAAALLAASAAAPAAAQPGLRLNGQGYLEAPGLNVLVYSNRYDGLFEDSKISGVELIHHGVRTATNGDVRLQPTPGQWDPYPRLVERRVDAAGNAVEATLAYPDHDFRFVLRAEARPAGGVTLSVTLDRPLPAALAGRAGLNLEFLPSAYFRRGLLADGQSRHFPLYPSSAMERGADGQVHPLPFARGRRLVLAPEDAERRVSIQATEGELALYDGRNTAQNGWFVVRTLLPAGRTGRVVEWTLEANTLPDWVRAPVIGHSQLGYHPSQPKTAVVEMDRNALRFASGGGPGRLLRVGEDGGMTEAWAGQARPWGDYLRYRYATLDFSAVREPGLYVLEYAGQRTAAFRIAPDVYAEAWHPTMDVFFPVQMDHVTVNEAYRVWHGASHLDDARQAPTDHVHLDLYAQGPTTDTRFAPGEHIPGLNVGGWYDAGDYDIRTQTQYHVVQSLVRTWEEFRPARDQTTVDQERRWVDVHVPDGVPDLLQQIEHGTLGLLAQFRAVGHAIPGIVEPDVAQYTHLGDAVTKTDGRVFDPSLRPGEVRGERSGTPDDRWAFTNRTSALNYGSIAALAAASRALRGWRDELAEECLAVARRVWDEEHARPPAVFRHGNTTGGPLEDEELRAATELLLATREDKYARRIEEMWPTIARTWERNAVSAARAMPQLGAPFRARMEARTREYRDSLAVRERANPYGVPITTGGWAGSGAVVRDAITQYTLHRAFPQIIPAERALRGLNYLYGTHPGSNVSLVSGVGAVSKEVAYGGNRADFSFIAGGVVPGVLILKPDFPENKEDWPFLWGENEYVINVAADYVYLVNAVDGMLGGRE